VICQESDYLDEYDFIIAGSGPGGCVLANRLTENKKWNVLVVEAGKVETFMQNIPLLAINNQNTQFDWVFKAEPQNYSCLGL
jgi:choline dehydrogenase-like flavoprotein